MECSQVPDGSSAWVRAKGRESVRGRSSQDRLIPETTSQMAARHRASDEPLVVSDDRLSTKRDSHLSLHREPCSTRIQTKTTPTTVRKIHSDFEQTKTPASRLSELTSLPFGCVSTHLRKVATGTSRYLPTSDRYRSYPSLCRLSFAPQAYLSYDQIITSFRPYSSFILFTIIVL